MKDRVRAAGYDCHKKSQGYRCYFCTYTRKPEDLILVGRTVLCRYCVVIDPDSVKIDIKNVVWDTGQKLPV
jgi:hypothetical protein